MPTKATVLWTGGKDSSLALFEATLSDCEIVNLVTFVPQEANFLAHPLTFMKFQATALGLPHDVVEIRRPFKQGYEEAIRTIKREYGSQALVTGDIAEVAGLPNWIRECSQHSGMNVLTPLWGWNRIELLTRLVSCGFRTIFSCVKEPWFTDEWLGKEITKDCIERLRRMSEESGLDACGEQGEYHTLVLDGPPFTKEIRLNSFRRQQRDSFMFLEIQEVTLRDK